MKNKGFTVSSLLALFMLVAGLVVPASLTSPASTEASPGILKWSTVDTPGSFGDRNDILWRSEVNKLVVSSRGTTLLAIITRTTVPAMQLFSSGSSGRTWGGNSHLRDAMLEEWGVFTNVWDANIAPDDPNFWAVASSSPTTNGPVEVWITRDGGTTWELTRLAAAWNTANPGSANLGFISAIDISPNYSGKRDIAVGIRNNANAGNTAQLEIWTLQSTGFTGWRQQAGTPVNSILPGAIAAAGRADVLALKFSPTYVGDASLAVVFSTNGASTPANATFFDIMLRDLERNQALGWVGSVEVKDPLSAAGASPDITTIVIADLELPSDFSGQSPSLRRAYVSFYSSPKGAANQNGIYRIDDNVVYVLMDTTNVSRKDISSIAYYGTYASGKLLAGEVYGNPCTATVPTWFTDSPTVCPIPCWYPALKPTTGAAGVDCAQGWGYGNAQVGWSHNGSLAFIGTGSACLGPFSIPNNAINCATPEWPDGYLNFVAWDESAFGISRNNGETWNQLGLIDTTITQFTDVAPSPDCKTIYLASVNNWNEEGSCDEFDSVWRSSINSAVTAPLSPTPPVGFYWERVFTHVTALSCTEVQTDLALLRLAPDKTDGELVGWAAQNTRAQMWSPDFGDFWANITPRHPIQDFAFESSTLLWNLASNAIVQKLPYTGTAWSSAQADMDSLLFQAHMIAAKPEGKLLVGAGATSTAALYPVAYSMNSGQNWSVIRDPLPTPGAVHVAFDTKFDDNNIIFAANDGNAVTALAAGSIYRYQLPWPAGGRWIDNDMLAATNGNCITSTRFVDGRFFGLQRAFTGDALYAAYTSFTAGLADNGTVLRTLWPLNGMPKPGIAWDVLDIFANPPATQVRFTLEPWSLKMCGCLTLNTDTVLYAIDNRDYDPGNRLGMLWAFTDCMAKKGPTLITEESLVTAADDDRAMVFQPDETAVVLF